MGLNPLKPQTNYSYYPAQNNIPPSASDLQYGSWNNSYNSFNRQKPQQKQIQNMGGIVWVNGVEGAKGFFLNPEESIILMDSDQDYFYLKETDKSGWPRLRAFEFNEITDKVINNFSSINNTGQKSEQKDIDEKLKQYITRDEFEIELKRILTEVVSNLVPTSTQNLTQTTSNENSADSTKKYLEKKKEG